MEVKLANLRVVKRPRGLVFDPTWDVYRGDMKLGRVEKHSPNYFKAYGAGIYLVCSGHNTLGEAVESLEKESE